MRLEVFYLTCCAPVCVTRGPHFHVCKGLTAAAAAAAVVDCHYCCSAGDLKHKVEAAWKLLGCL